MLNPKMGRGLTERGGVITYFSWWLLPAGNTAGDGLEKSLALTGMCRGKTRTQASL